MSARGESYLTFPADDPRHGTPNGYGNLGCRCDACRTANTANMRMRGWAGYARDACTCGRSKYLTAATCRPCSVAALAAVHGTESKYRGGCRCAQCREAARVARARRRAAA